MRVLLINKFFRPAGGAESVLFETKQLLEEGGHEVIPFAMKDARNDPTEWAGFFAPRREYRSGPAAARARDALAAVYSRSARTAIGRLVRECEPDVAHLHNIYHQLSLSIIDALSAALVPIVMTLHDYKAACPSYQLLTHDGRCLRCVDGGRYWHATQHRCIKGSLLASTLATLEAYVNRFRRQYEKVDRFIAPSSFLRDVVVRSGLPLDRIDVIPNPVAAAPARPNPLKPLFLYFGRLSHEKGLDVLLEATNGLAPRARVVVFGTGPLEPVLTERVAAEQLPIELRGHVDPKEVRLALSQATAAILPARAFENCPMSILEAAAHGVPTIASNLGGIPELITDGHDGVLVPPEDVSALRSAMNTLSRDTRRASELGQRARERVRVRNSQVGYLQRILTTYHSAVVRRLPDSSEKAVA